MISRTRFYWMLGFLLIAITIAVTATVDQIQTHLLVSGQAAIAAAEIPYYNLRIDGRDAVLQGFVAEGTDMARLVSVVARVPGVRAVHNELTVERISQPGDRTVLVLAATRAPELHAQHLGGLLVVTGRLPADGSVDALEEALRVRFPGTTLRIDVRSDAAVSAREWTSSLGLAVAALAELGEPARLAAYGDVVQLAGQIAGPSGRAELEDILAGAPAVEWRLTLTHPSGGIGGRP